ncbi:hypothetical protein TSOC_010779 [Tetrabaena socialis]|uniref:FAS1 domain-containing protein n=1 Tax=Tetrabaena socialis TaxID=47790 RepID=A0A2J7ZSF1_9CHLO|nr:hypothetical protein TSOC_010779 [Tetrabaena socialis]|eukprot:PNH03199.1 hypothetical protein TSOC_010779 [Tetrabaena socialis]
MTNRAPVLALMALVAALAVGASAAGGQGRTLLQGKATPINVSKLPTKPAGGPSIEFAIQALNATGLVGAATNETVATIFAPDDPAIQSLAARLNLSRAQLLTSPAVLDVIKLHIIPGVALRSTDLPQGKMVNETSLAGRVLLIKRSGNAVSAMVEGSNVTAEVVQADIPYNRVVVYIINRVLMPPTGMPAITAIPPTTKPAIVTPKTTVTNTTK